MKNKLLDSSVILILVLIFSSCNDDHKKNHTYAFQNPELSIDERVDNLVSLLTLEEKVSQMVNNSAPIERLGIPAYNWWNESLHGVARTPYKVTSYPQAIGLAATWDTLSIKKMADYCAVEGRAIYNDSRKKGETGIYLGLTYWSPNVNIFRDPRWGRGQETYGEDPYLTGSLGKAFVKGLQGDDPKYLKASACAKHFAVHSGPEWNRSTFNAQVSNYDLWNTYLPAFKDLIVDANVSGVMCAYNAVDGQPCCSNDRLMINILRNKWNFNGYVTSDCGGINHFWKTHKTHPNSANAAADAVLHGTDLECSSEPAFELLGKAINNRLITENQIDVSLKRLFSVRFKLGMFDPQNVVPYSKIDTSVLESKEHKAHALKMARESMVLLKNENNILPLSKELKKIAVVGPNADNEIGQLANYYGYPSEIISVLEGISEKVGRNKIIYERGVNFIDNNVFEELKDDNQLLHNGNQFGFFGEYFTNPNFDGNPVMTRSDEKIDYKWGDGEKISKNVIARNFSIRWSTIFKPKESGDYTFRLKGDDGARLFVNGKKELETESNYGYYTLKAKRGKAYNIKIEYWQYNDNSEVQFELGVREKKVPKEISSQLAMADAIIFVGGISAQLEGEDMPVEIEGFKGGDRTNIALPTIQTELLKELNTLGKPLVFVNMSGGAMGFEWEAKNIPAIIQAWYPGQAGGEAIADVLFGDYNPAGRLPVTFYKNIDQLPDFEDYDMDNRTYRYFEGKPLYAFGHGLSYTEFKYSNIKIKREKEDSLLISVNVENIGDFAGDEVTQLYLSYNSPSSNKGGVINLKGFDRYHLKSGESRSLTFYLDQDDLSEINEFGERNPIKGEVTISVGGSQPLKQALITAKCIQKKHLL